MLIVSLDAFPRTGREYAIAILGDFIRFFPEDPRKPRILQICLEHLSYKLMDNPDAIKTLGRAVIIALGKIGDPFAESHLVSLLKKDKFMAVSPQILFSLGRCARTLNTVLHVSMSLDSQKPGERLAACWAIGRVCSRENGYGIPVGELDNIITSLGKLAVEDEHAAVRRFAVYAMGEICDRRLQEAETEPDLIGKDMADYAEKVLHRARNAASVRNDIMSTDDGRLLMKTIDVALVMIGGTLLAQNQVETLTAVRSMMA